MSLISFDQKRQLFHLNNGHVSYIMKITEGLLSSVYFGQAIPDYHGSLSYPLIKRDFMPNLADVSDRAFSPNVLPREFSASGDGDLREPALQVKHENGANALQLRVANWTITDGKPQLSGLPAAYLNDPSEAQTLEIVLKDLAGSAKVTLSYTIFANYDIITRSVRVKNTGSATLTLDRVASMQVDLPAADFDLLTLPGTHMGERQLQLEPINIGLKKISSNGGVSSHQENPFIALTSPQATEETGTVYGFALVYSGNHGFWIQKDQFGQLRILAGINDENFSWTLPAGSEFQTPEVWLTYSHKGLGAMSRQFHGLVKHNLVRGQFKQQARPILVNSWEAAYFDFDEDKLKPLATEAAKEGMELFVLDDGWFGHRNASDSSLGDWVANPAKFPHGLRHFSDFVHDLGLKFGIWVEPEMISIDSNLYRTHPDYLVKVPQYAPLPSRRQYILNLTLPEVRENLFTQLKTLIVENGIDYVKWDMNRPLVDLYAANLQNQGEFSHRYILGVYQLVDRLVSAFPEVLFEGCASGGGRFDLGWAYYMPQSWTSDNTDAMARTKIQYATSLVYPPSVMTAHVSDVPNQQTGRVVPLKTRYNVAASAMLGYELDLTKLDSSQQAAIANQIADYKGIRDLIMNGELYRLSSPFTSQKAAWEFLAPDRKTALVTVVVNQIQAQPRVSITKLAGLIPEAIYEEQASGCRFSGAELMRAGFFDKIFKHDYDSVRYLFKAVHAE
ncbi:alpha-galactosidase [Lactobacillus porci]|uniref:alpha-galactosidase n=1 Tax=Lactobacillus porci TaxID=2012477 RepID=UPI00399547BE